MKISTKMEIAGMLYHHMLEFISCSGENNTYEDQLEILEWMKGRVEWSMRVANSSQK